MNENTTEVAVIIPVYNQPELLEDALNSVKNQTYSNYSVVVVDDNSSVDMSEVVEKFGDKFDYIKHSINKGAAEARNTGIEHSEGDFIAFLDADDVWEPMKLEKQIKKFHDSPSSTGLVYTGMIQEGIEGERTIHEPQSAGHIYLDELKEDHILPTSTVMVKRSCIDDVGDFDGSLPSRQDYDLWIRITEGYRVDYVDEPLVEKREQRDNISRDYDARVKGDLAVFEKVKSRTTELDKQKRDRILSTHHHTIGRDYLFNREKKPALRHLSTAIRKNPAQVRSWVLFVLAVANVDTQGKLFHFLENLSHRLNSL